MTNFSTTQVRMTSITIRCLDDIFCLFENAHYINIFQRFLNSKYI